MQNYAENSLHWKIQACTGSCFFLKLRLFQLTIYFSKGKKVYACFVDFSKAYDSVWRKGLLYKLIINGLSFQFISLIDSMYSELKAAVKLSNGITPFFNSAVGLRQGCNLSPLLLNIFVNDIFDIFNDLKCCPVKLNNKPITSLMYADDLLILSETEDGLKESLQRLGKYAKQWKMKISAKKTKIMVFSKQGRKSDMKVKLYDLVIESCEQYPYLGTVFTPRNNFKTAHKMSFIRRPKEHSLDTLKMSISVQGRK